MTPFDGLWRIVWHHTHGRADEFECALGQGESKARITTPTSTNDNSYDSCAARCRTVQGCHAFDFSTTSNSSRACRTYGANVPRIGDAGVDSRTYCSRKRTLTVCCLSIMMCARPTHARTRASKRAAAGARTTPTSLLRAGSGRGALDKPDPVSNTANQKPRAPGCRCVPLLLALASRLRRLGRVWLELGARIEHGQIYPRGHTPWPPSLQSWCGCEPLIHLLLGGVQTMATRG